MKRLLIISANDDLYSYIFELCKNKYLIEVINNINRETSINNYICDKAIVDYRTAINYYGNLKNCTGKIIYAKSSVEIYVVSPQNTAYIRDPVLEKYVKYLTYDELINKKDKILEYLDIEIIASECVCVAGLRFYYNQVLLIS